MKQIFFLYLLTAIILGTNPLYAQDEQEAATLDRGPISGQFDYAIENSSKYEEYRVVRSAWLNKLKSNVLDSLENLRTQIASKNSQIDSLNNHIGTLNKELEDTQNNLEEALTAKNSIPFLGAEIQKGKYNSIMWGLVLILAAAFAFVFFLFKRSHHLTAQLREKYDDLEKEFDAHRKRVLEKEKVVARQHLNELNKLRGRD